MKKIKKKHLIVVGVVAFVTFIVFAIWAFNSQTKNAQAKVDELSERAKEFIEEEKKKSGSSWKSAEFGENTQQQENLQPKTFTTDCMTVKFPVTSRNEHVRNEQVNCKVELRMDSPPARVVIAYKLQSSPLSEDSGVILRRKFTDEYIFKPTQYSLWSESLRFDQKDGTVLFLKQDGILITVGITEMLQPERLTDELVDRIVEGIIL